MTKVVIRIAMMTAVRMRRHRKRLEKLRLVEGVPPHTHTYLTRFGNSRELRRLIIPSNAS